MAMYRYNKYFRCERSKTVKVALKMYGLYIREVFALFILLVKKK